MTNLIRRPGTRRDYVTLTPECGCDVAWIGPLKWAVAQRAKHHCHIDPEYFPKHLR